MMHIQSPVNYRKIRHIHVLFKTYSRPIQDIFSHILAYLEPCVTLAYSKLCHIQNPGIFRNQDIFRINSVKAHSNIFRTLCNARILRTVPHSELIQNYSELIIQNFD